MGVNMLPLSRKQELFVGEYIIDGNASQAAVRAGYSPVASKVTAHRMLNKPHVAAAVDAAYAERRLVAGIKAEDIMNELAKIAFANMDDYAAFRKSGDTSEISRDQAAAIGEITVEMRARGGGNGVEQVKRVKFKLMDKRAALVDLGKQLGMFVDRSKVDHGGEVKLIISRADEDCA